MIKRFKTTIFLNFLKWIRLRLEINGFVWKKEKKKKSWKKTKIEERDINVSEIVEDGVV